MDQPLSLYIKFGYGLGHVLNDLCASMWFTYLLLFYHQVLEFNNTYAGIILLVGQVADGVSTTIVGSLCDGKSEEGAWLCRRYGQRKAWHLVGTCCILVSFPFVFLPCLGCAHSDEWAQLIYYSAFAVIFQFGWASVQISHLALIPALTSSQNERTGLTAIRYGMTVVSNLTVYTIAWVVLGQSNSQSISEADVDKFRNIMLIVLGLGVATSLAFHLIVKEVPSTDMMSGYEEINGDSKDLDFVQPMTKRDWFWEPQFYQVALVYMGTRLFVNLSQAYIPIYLQDSLETQSKYVAIIPLVMYSSGFFTSFIMKVLNRKAGRKVSYLLGAVLGLVVATWIDWGDTLNYDWFKAYGIFIAAAMYGAAGAAMLITSLSLTAELIAANTESAAFVYGAMSFTDKVSNGLAVMLIQYMIPPFKDCDACKWYFREVLFYATGAAALLGSLGVCIMGRNRIGARRRDRLSDVLEEERQGLLQGTTHNPVTT